MPRAKVKCKPTLAVQVDEPTSGNPFFSPGDTLVGRIVRQKHVDSPRARVSVELHGRAKVTIFDYNSLNITRFSHTQLIDGAESSLMLYDGPVHLSSTEKPLSWPFSVTIPAYVSIPDVAAPTSSTEMLLDKECMFRQPLPSTTWISIHRANAYIEYWLEARLQLDDQAILHGKYRATMPFILRTCQIGSRILDFGQSMYFWNLSIATQRLNPDCKNAKLSTMEYVKKLFRTSSVPKVYLQLQMWLPRIVQVDPPGLNAHQLTDPMDVFIRVVPDETLVSEVILTAPLQARLTFLRMTLVSTTIMTAGFFLNYAREYLIDTFDLTPHVYPFLKNNSTNLLCSPYSLPLNVGQMFNLRLCHDFAPSMEIDNIQRRYMMSWKVKLEVARESVTIRGLVPVRVLGSIHPLQLRNSPNQSPPNNGSLSASTPVEDESSWGKEVSIQGLDAPFYRGSICDF